MKVFLGTAAILIALAFVVPMVAGGSADICLDVMMNGGSLTAAPVTDGNSAIMYSVIDSTTESGNAVHAPEAARYPHIPTLVSCTAAFWRGL
ncbi:hypothetical protein [Acidocella sp.]|uniref:hypothetical protein n=1 Tax=Acidocella sp. TaxID=50710 RepID=UPI0026353ECB|nr:hypothetical protein [Acidocella sp.]